MHQYKGLKLPIFICLLVILAIPLVISNDFAFGFITAKNFTFRIAVEVLFALYLLLMLYDSQYQPKFSWILVSFTLLLFFCIISAFLGVDPEFSFFGSYLRMEGIITLIGLFMYFLALSHILKTPKAWTQFFYVSVSIALLVGIQAIIRECPCSTLGNNQFSAIYLFFSIFFIALLMARSPSIYTRYLLAAIALFLGYIMLQTGERGVVCAAVCASIVSISYISRYRKTPYLKYFLIALTGCIILIVGFLIMFPIDFTNHKTGFMRYLNVDMYKQGILLRGHLWGMALKGFKDYPIFGWGFNNFSYVFNKYYNSFYCNYDMWMDRVHNNYLEWLMAGGIIGFITFLGFLCAPIITICKTAYKSFTNSERAILLGLFSGYLVLNIFYFDTITSYVCLITVLAFIHAHVSTPLPKWEISKKYIPVTVAPILVIAISASIYYLTIPSLLAAREAMIATQAPDIIAQYQKMHQAWMRQGVGNLEMLDKFKPIVMNLLVNSALPMEEKIAIARQTEVELKQFIANKPQDPNAYYFLTLLLVTINDLENAQKTIYAASLLTPGKEYTMMLQGLVAMSMQHTEEARNLFEKSMCVAESKVLYEQLSQR